RSMVCRARSTRSASGRSSAGRSSTFSKRGRSRMTAAMAEPRPSFLDGPLRLYIDGEFVGTEGRLTVLNPATGEPLAEAPLAGEHAVDQPVSAASAAFPAWRFAPPSQRARLMWALADRLEEHAEEFATIEVLDNGKPLAEA